MSLLADLKAHRKDTAEIRGRLTKLEAALPLTAGNGIKVDGKTISTDPDDATVVKPLLAAVTALKTDLDKVVKKVGA